MSPWPACPAVQSPLRLPGWALAVALAACTPHSDPTHNVVGEMVPPKVETVEMVDGGMEVEEPCDKPKTPDTDREPLEMVEGEMPMPERPLAGAMVMPPPPPEAEMVKGEIEVPPPEVDDSDVHARGSRQVLHFDD